MDDEFNILALRDESDRLRKQADIVDSALKEIVRLRKHIGGLDGEIRTLRSQNDALEHKYRVVRQELEQRRD